jgi:hypothetical protein
VFEYPTSAAKVLVLGRAANLKVFRNRTSAEHLHLRFGKVEEVDAAGRPIPKRAINSLAALQPTSYSTGVCVCLICVCLWVGLRKRSNKKTRFESQRVVWRLINTHEN